MTTPDDPGGRPLGTILVTGAGGAAAVTLLRSFAPHARIIAGDMDPYAVGLYLARPEDRVVLPRADDPAFLAELLQAAIDHDTDLVVPTVDVELLAVAKARETFGGHGIRLLVESEQTHELTHLYQQLVPGGILIIDDYGSWQGSREATDEFLQETGEPLMLVRIGRTRVTVKPGLSRP